MCSPTRSPLTVSELLIVEQMYQNDKWKSEWPGFKSWHCHFSAEDFGIREAGIHLLWNVLHHSGHPKRVPGWCLPSRRPHWTVPCLSHPVVLSPAHPFPTATFQVSLAFCGEVTKAFLKDLLFLKCWWQPRAKALHVHGNLFFLIPHLLF